MIVERKEWRLNVVEARNVGFVNVDEFGEAVFSGSKLIKASEKGSRSILPATLGLCDIAFCTPPL